jgi:MarR family transcriptional regulator, transcriptional regulator for hemolysin
MIASNLSPGQVPPAGTPEPTPVGMPGLPPPAGTPADRARLVERIGDGIRAVAGQQRCSMARHLHRTGISMAHLQVLWILGEHGPLPVGRVAELLGVAVPNATGLIDRMAQRGLVARERVADDRRVVLVQVTAAGRSTADEVDGWRATVLERLLDRFDRQDLARIAEALDETLAELRLAADPDAAGCGAGASAMDRAPGAHTRHTIATHRRRTAGART